MRLGPEGGLQSELEGWMGWVVGIRSVKSGNSRCPVEPSRALKVPLCKSDEGTPGRQTAMDTPASLAGPAPAQGTSYAGPYRWAWGSSWLILTQSRNPSLNGYLASPRTEIFLRVTGVSGLGLWKQESQSLEPAGEVVGGPTYGRSQGAVGLRGCTSGSQLFQSSPGLH